MSLYKLACRFRKRLQKCHYTNLHVVSGNIQTFISFQEIRNSVDNVLLLDAGDAYQGTIWFYVYRGMATAHFMNLLEYDAMVSIIIQHIYKTLVVNYIVL